MHVNTYNFKGKTVEIEVSNKQGKILGVGLIDLQDVEKASKKHWRIDGCGYLGNVKERLHIYLLGRKKGHEIDHINRNKLDCRRKNLRFVTRSQNCHNKDHKGYHLVKGKYWIVQIRVRGKHIHIGSFKSEIAAKVARKLAVNKYIWQNK